MDRELIADCVHCGFCLPACPTYDLWGEEMDSPRGRIYLMKTALEDQPDGDTAEHPQIDPVAVRHFDACLGCMACVTACPSGVRYGDLIELTRENIENTHKRPWRDRLFRRTLFTLFPGRRRLRGAAVFAWLYQLLGLRSLVRRTGLLRVLPARLRALEAMLPDVGARAVVARTPAVTPADGPRQQRVGFITGCVQEVFFGDVNAATVRALTAHGCEVVAPRSQGCCGALEVHGGYAESARRRARSLIDTFADVDVGTIVINAAGCGSSLKEYGTLLADDPEYAGKAAEFAGKVRDVTEVLAELEPAREYGRVDLSVVYHDACHLAHAQGIRAQPRALLGRVPGIELRPLPDDGFCCGSAGVYNLLNPDAAGELGQRKADELGATGADAVVTTNPGCALQIKRYLGGTPVLHPAQVLDRSLADSPTSRNNRKETG